MVMKLRWPTCHEEAEYLKWRQRQNRVRSRNNANESWMSLHLQKTNLPWKAQALWGYRIFDFWCARIGVAVEVDGPEHRDDYDRYRDEYNFRRSGVIVLRVPNRDEPAAGRAVQSILKLDLLIDRRRRMLLTDSHTKKLRRRLLSLPCELDLRLDYMAFCERAFANPPQWLSVRNDVAPTLF